MDRKPVFHQEAPSWIRAAIGSLGRIAPGLAARVAADMFMRPFRPKPHARELKWLADARPENLPTRHGKLAGWSWGEGPSVVLIHGWNSRGSQMGWLARAIASRGFRAVVFDGPAHGRSPGRRTNLINHSAALVDVATGVPDLHGIVGHSFGALAASFRWSELPPLKRVVMVSPPAEMKLYSRMFMQAIGGSDEVHRRIITADSGSSGMNSPWKPWRRTWMYRSWWFTTGPTARPPSVTASGPVRSGPGPACTKRKAWAIFASSETMGWPT